MTKLKKEVGRAMLRPGYAIAVTTLGMLSYTLGGGALLAVGALSLVEERVEAPSLALEVTEEPSIGRLGYGYRGYLGKAAQYRTLEIRDGGPHAIATFGAYTTTINGDLVVRGSLRVVDETGRDLFRVAVP